MSVYWPPVCAFDFVTKSTHLRISCLINDRRVKSTVKVYNLTDLLTVLIYFGPRSTSNIAKNMSGC